MSQSDLSWPGLAGLITRRSQVQILPPLLRKALETGPSAFSKPHVAVALRGFRESPLTDSNRRPLSMKEGRGSSDLVRRPVTAGGRVAAGEQGSSLYRL